MQACKFVFDGGAGLSGGQMYVCSMDDRVDILGVPGHGGVCVCDKQHLVVVMWPDGCVN